jgi:predicted nuclease of predicted toxin-antitoxin system
MKILLDTCVWGGARNHLEAAGHDVVWAGDWREDPGDEEILAHAHKEARILVTLDKDFGEMAIAREIPHSGIIRLVNFRAREQGVICLRVIGMYGNELQRGALVTAEPGRLRIRPSGFKKSDGVDE